MGAPSFESSCSRSPLPSPSAMTMNAGLAVKAHQSHGNLSISDICIAWDNITHDNNDIAQNDLLLSKPWPAPHPPITITSPVPSPDLFSLMFTDVSYKFPHPFQFPLHFILAPLPPCLSHLQIQACVCGSACCHLHCLCSDNEFMLPSPRFNIQSLLSSH